MAVQEEELRQRLTTHWLGSTLSFKEQTGSTNDDVRAAVSKGAVEGHLVWADHQVEGRGRRGRSWSSPPNTDLYFSFALPSAKFRLGTGLDIALGVADAVAHWVTETEVQVKWPNDVLIGERKCAGILVESVSHGSQRSAVAGVGINVNRRKFEPGMRLRPTSVCLALGRSVDRTEFLAFALGRIEHWVDQPLCEVVPALEDRLAFRDQTVTIDPHVGVIKGLSPSGALRLETADGIKELVAGEIDLQSTLPAP